MFSLRQFIFDTFLPALCVLGIVYNCLIAINGAEGVRARALVNEKLDEKAQELSELKAYRAQLENRANLLSLTSLNEDMLEESARRILGYAEGNEHVLPMAELDRLIQQSLTDTR